MQTVNEKDIARLIGSVTGRGEFGEGLTYESRLLGVVAELDSLAVMNLIVTLEKQYGIQWHDDEMDESIFVTLGSLTDFVQLKSDVMKSTDMPASKNQQSK